MCESRCPSPAAASALLGLRRQGKQDGVRMLSSSKRERASDRVQTRVRTVKKDLVRNTGNDKTSNGLPKTEDIVRNQTNGEINGPMYVIQPRQELRHNLLRKRREMSVRDVPL